MISTSYIRLLAKAAALFACVHSGAASSAPLYYYAIGGPIDSPSTHVVAIDFGRGGTQTASNGTVTTVSNSYWADYISGPAMNTGVQENNYAINQLTALGTEDPYIGQLHVANSFSVNTLADICSFGTWQQTGGPCSFNGDMKGERLQHWEAGTPLSTNGDIWTAETSIQEKTNSLAVNGVPIPAPLYLMISGLAVLAVNGRRNSRRGIRTWFC